jgi:hypothetical protein
MLSHEVPPAPGLVLSSDYAEFRGKSYVIIVDQFSGMAEHFAVANKSPRELIRCFLLYIARNGVPTRIVYDAQGSYVSHEFLQFCDQLGIKCVYCSPEHHQGNGLAESGVKRFKKWLSCSSSNLDLALCMLQWAQTPMAPGRPSPAQIHYGRNLRDDLHNRVEPAVFSWSELKQWKEASNDRVAQTYNRGAKKLEPLTVGTEVFVNCRNVWRPGVITKVLEQPRAYSIRLHDTGRVIDRNRKFLRVNVTGKKSGFRAPFEQSLFSPDIVSTSDKETEDEDVFIPVETTGSPVPTTGPAPTQDLGDPASSSLAGRQRRGLWDRQREFLEKTKTTRSGRIVQFQSRDYSAL